MPQFLSKTVSSVLPSQPKSFPCHCKHKNRGGTVSLRRRATGACVIITVSHNAIVANSRHGATSK